MAEPIRPLAGLRVLELPGVAPMFCGKLFADLGAEVVKVEPPDGDPARRLDPLLPSVDGPVSATWLSYSFGKRSWAVDLKDGDALRQLREAINTADVVLHGYLAPETSLLGLSPSEFSSANPTGIVISVTPFGADGPLSGWLGDDLVHIAMGGYLQMTGEANGRPIRPSVPIQSYLHAGNHAFIAALLGLRRRKLTGRGAVVDQAIRDTASWQLTHTYQHWDMQRVNLKRQGQGRDMGGKKRLKMVYRSADGFVVLMFTTGHLGLRANTALVARMDAESLAPAWLKAIDWMETDLLNTEPGLAERLESALSAYFARHTGQELLDWAIGSGLMLAPVNTVADVAVDPQLAYRHSWVSVEQPGLGTVRVPGPPIRLRGIEWSPAGPAPALGSSTAPEWPARPVAPAHGDSALLPLTGIRVLDLGTTLAAPTAARHMADFGADVIKVESLTHPDTLRVGTPYAGGEAGVDRSGYFGGYNAGKRSFALNLRSPGAADVIRRLVESADILVENFAPGVMERLELPPERLHEWNPRLVIASHSLQGQVGPRSRHRGYGQIASAMTGWYDLTGEFGGEPLGPYSAYTDFLSWPFLLSAILLALDERDRTGDGQYIDHAQVESSLHFLAPLLLDHEITRAVPTRRGNAESLHAPVNTYRCATGEPWLAIAVRSDETWRGLCSALGALEFVADPRYATAAARVLNASNLDAWLDQRLAAADAHEWAYRLQEAGVPAGPVARGADLFADPQYSHRRFFRRLDHPILGDHAVITQSFRINGLEAGPHRAAPLLGEHTFEIATQLLGIPEDEVARLVEAQVLH
ncbi:MAG: CaiB/BaiF CoA transferase family protein [Dehalococcoidia bacterium]